MKEKRKIENKLKQEISVVLENQYTGCDWRYLYKVHTETPQYSKVHMSLEIAIPNYTIIKNSISGFG